MTDEASANDQPPPKKTGLYKLVGVFADVRPGELGSALLLTLNVFLLLGAYYLLKVAREPLILTGGGAEVKSYASAGQTLLLVFVTSFYSWVSSRLTRIALITWVTLVFIGCLIGFWFLGERGLPLGIPFFLWVGIFNLMAVAQFWSFAADIYTDEQGKRIFPLIGIGSSVGAVAGAWLAERLTSIGPYRLMLVSAGMLVVTLGLYYATDRGETGHATPNEAKKAEAKLSAENGFALVFRDKYLIFIALMLLVLNIVTKTGDYVFDRKLLQAAHDAGAIDKTAAVAFISAFKARYFLWGNGIGVVLQLFAVSRIIKYLGLRVALVIMPVVSLMGYGAALIFPMITVLFAARAVESSLDYSLSNTVRQALWLVTSRDAKYKAKQVIDGFVVRFGDMMSAAVVFIGSKLVLPPAAFLLLNLALTVVWLFIALALGKIYVNREHHDPKKAPTSDDQKTAKA